MEVATSHLEFSIRMSQPKPGKKIARALGSIYSNLGLPPTSRPLVLCIGSDRATGDSLGPLVGSLLTWKGFLGQVLGTLDEPVHACNLEEAVSKAKSTKAKVLGVDACLGTKAEVGTIMVKRGPLQPGLGVKKQLPCVGDLHIAGVVNVGGFMEHLVLQNTRLSSVLKMAQAIAWGIIHAGQYMRCTHPGYLPNESPPVPHALSGGLKRTGFHQQLFAALE